MATTQYSPLFGDTYTSVDARGPQAYNLRRVVRRSGFRKTKELFDTLIGAAVGGAALLTHKQIAEDTSIGGVGGGGGLRTIETITDINRNSTAADITALKALTFNVKMQPSPYPVDLSGNGGPAFTPGV